MKQKYVKPAMAIEYFTLTQSVALNCSTETYDPSFHYNQTSPSNCEFMPAGKDSPAIFVYTVGVNTACIVSETQTDFVCYNGPESQFAAFAS